MPIMPSMPVAPVREEHWIGKLPPDGAGAHGQAYTDGALRESIPRGNRAKWAFVVDAGKCKLWGRYGVCAEPAPSW